MTFWDWIVVVVLNLLIISFGIYQSRKTTSTVDWFLAARGLPWWIVGLSMFATAVDSGDYVAVAGNAYKQGLSYISAWWIGIATGWVLLSFVVIVPMYQRGMFTNTEYLEYRFGPAARILSVFIQIQYRTNVLANVSWSLYLTFNVLTGDDNYAWALVIGIAIGAGIYTSLGGLQSVAITDAIQSIVMLVASVVFWCLVYQHVGGWSGFENSLTSTEGGAELVGQLTHVGASTGDAPAWLVVLGWMITISAYCVVNQSQAMRMLAAKSIWDLRMAAVVAASVTMIVMWFNVTLGILGRAAYPALTKADEIYPRLMESVLLPFGYGLAGIVVAGLLAGGLSTYDSIGSALSSVFIRDFYARFLVKNQSDRHYLMVSRIFTLLVILASFAYVPFLQSEGMVTFYLKMTKVAVIPLFTVYIVGLTTRVHRRTGTIGILAGVVISLAQTFSEGPAWWTNVWWGYLWTMFATSAAMLFASCFLGWETRETLEKHLADQQCEWLNKSREQVPKLKEHPFKRKPGWYASPILWTILVIAVIVYFNFVVMW